ncbi:MAG: hypothetical protein GMKNLPBB_02368 [Myxococcota bacterium]|nr:hypothetical protein [Myxococcota bacterium]
MNLLSIIPPELRRQAEERVEQKLNAINPMIMPFLRDQSLNSVKRGELRLSESTLNRALGKMGGGSRRMNNIHLGLSRRAIALDAQTELMGEAAQIKLSVQLLRVEASKSAILIDFRVDGPIAVEIAGTQSRVDGNLPGKLLKRAMSAKSSSGEPVVEELHSGVFRLHLNRMDAIRELLKQQVYGVGVMDILRIPTIYTADGAIAVQLRMAPGAAGKLFNVARQVASEQAQKLLAGQASLVPARARA